MRPFQAAQRTERLSFSKKDHFFTTEHAISIIMTITTTTTIIIIIISGFNLLVDIGCLVDALADAAT
jgi:hypothetical protein